MNMNRSNSIYLLLFFYGFVYLSIKCVCIWVCFSLHNFLWPIAVLLHTDISWDFHVVIKLTCLLIGFSFGITQLYCFIDSPSRKQNRIARYICMYTCSCFWWWPHVIRKHLNIISHQFLCYVISGHFGIAYELPTSICCHNANECINKDNNYFTFKIIASHSYQTQSQ